jgi:hypothetical protein
LPLTMDVYADIDWNTAKVNIGVDLGIHDATVCTAKIRWIDKEHNYHMRTIAQWYHSNGQIRYEKWDCFHRDKTKAMLDPNHKTPMEYCAFIEEFYQFVWSQVCGKLVRHNKIEFQMDTSSAIAGGTWFNILFIPRQDGMSILHPNQRGGCPSYLDAFPVWSKFGDVIEERIPPFLHLFTIPDCYTTISELECEAFENARWTYDNKRDENPRDKTLLIDVLNSIEYSLTTDDYYDIEEFYQDWVNQLGQRE